jgi:protein O-mannosyl-transferase
MLTRDNDYSLPVTFRFPEGRRYAFAFITLFVFLLVVYGNSFHGEFHFDDYSNIIENPNVHMKELSFESLKRTFVSPIQMFRPVSYMTFAVNYLAGGLSVTGYHVVNFAIHYLSALFLFLLIYNTLNLPRLKEQYGSYAYSAALLTSFFWAASPVQVHAVTIIVQRMASLAGLFYVVSMYLYVKGRTTSHPARKVVFFFFCALSALLSFGTKENSVMLPVSIYLYDLFLIQGVTTEGLRKNLKVLIPLMAVVLIAGLIYLSRSSLLDGYGIRPFTMTQRLLTEPRVILFYISLLLYPVSPRLMLLHDVDISTSLFSPWTTLPAILLILCLIALAFFLARKRPLIAFSILFFFVNHVIEGSIIPLELIFEHRNYIPSMFFFLPFAAGVIWVLHHFSYSKPIQYLAAVVLLFVLAGQGYTTYTRNGIAGSQMALWRDNADKAPGLSIVHSNLGKQYGRGQPEDARIEYGKAIKLNRYMNKTQAGVAYHNLGLWYLQEKGDWKRAAPCFRRAMSLSSGHREVWSSVAVVELMAGNVTGAYSFVEQGLAHWPEDVPLRNNLSVLLLRSGRLDEAIREGLKVLAVEPENAAALGIIGEAYRRKGQYGTSALYWETYVKNRPLGARGYCALVELYAKTGQKRELTKAIAVLLTLERGRGLREVIKDQARPADFSAYVADPATILPMVEQVLRGEGREIP